MESLVLADNGPHVIRALLPLLIPLYVLFILTVITVKGLICCRIFSKAGFSWALGLLMLVPIADIIMAFVLAFSEWPVQQQLRLAARPQSS
jgi:hypothetical protein